MLVKRSFVKQLQLFPLRKDYTVYSRDRQLIAIGLGIGQLGMARGTDFKILWQDGRSPRFYYEFIWLDQKMFGNVCYYFGLLCFAVIEGNIYILVFARRNYLVIRVFYYFILRAMCGSMRIIVMLLYRDHQGKI